MISECLNFVHVSDCYCVRCISQYVFSIFFCYTVLWWSIWARDIKSPRRWVTLSCLPRNSYNLEYYIWQGQNGKDEYFFCFLLLSYVALLEPFNALLLHFFDSLILGRYYIQFQHSLRIIQIFRDIHRKLIRISFFSFKNLSVLPKFNFLL